MIRLGRTMHGHLVQRVKTLCPGGYETCPYMLTSVILQETALGEIASAMLNSGATVDDV